MGANSPSAAIVSNPSDGPAVSPVDEPDPGPGTTGYGTTGPGTVHAVGPGTDPTSGTVAPGSVKDALPDTPPGVFQQLPHHQPGSLLSQPRKPEKKGSGAMQTGPGTLPPSVMAVTSSAAASAPGTAQTQNAVSQVNPADEGPSSTDTASAQTQQRSSSQAPSFNRHQSSSFRDRTGGPATAPSAGRQTSLSQQHAPPPFQPGSAGMSQSSHPQSRHSQGDQRAQQPRNTHCPAAGRTLQTQPPAGQMARQPADDGAGHAAVSGPAAKVGSPFRLGAGVDGGGSAAAVAGMSAERSASAVAAGARPPGFPPSHPQRSTPGTAAPSQGSRGGRTGSPPGGGTPPAARPQPPRPRPRPLPPPPEDLQGSYALPPTGGGGGAVRPTTHMVQPSHVPGALAPQAGLSADAAEMQEIAF